MIFVDCKEYLEKSGISFDELLKRGWDVGVAWHDGRQHGGKEHIRINLALPKSLLTEAFDRMKKYVFI